MTISREDFADRIDKFLEYLDEDDLKAYDSQLKNARKECSYCKQTIYDTNINQGWKVFKTFAYI